MQQGIKCTELWHIMCFFYWCSDLIPHTQTDTAHSGAIRLTHLYNYILTPPVICSQQLPLLHQMIKWIIDWYQKFTFIYLLIRCYKTRFFLWNTNNTDRNGVSKQNTHTHTHTHTHTPNFLRNVTLERVSYYENKWYPSPLF